MPRPEHAPAVCSGSCRADGETEEQGDRKVAHGAPFGNVGCANSLRLTLEQGKRGEPSNE